MIEFFNVFLLNLILKFLWICWKYINSNFNEKENLKELFPYSDKNVFFKCFLLMKIQLLFSEKSVIGFPMEKKPVSTKMNFLS